MKLPITHLPKPNRLRLKPEAPMIIAIYGGSGLITFAIIAILYCILR